MLIPAITLILVAIIINKYKKYFLQKSIGKNKNTFNKSVNKTTTKTLLIKNTKKN